MTIMTIIVPLFIALIWGIVVFKIIAGIVNMFLRNAMMDFIVSGIGVLVFAGLTAYDSQKIRQMLQMQSEINESTQKLALFGSLSLYLDFINIFLYLLRFFGSSRD